jgi:hypothetical protein
LVHRPERRRLRRYLAGFAEASDERVDRFSDAGVRGPAEERCGGESEREDDA